MEAVKHIYLKQKKKNQRKLILIPKTLSKELHNTHRARELQSSSSISALSQIPNYSDIISFNLLKKLIPSIQNDN